MCKEEEKIAERNPGPALLHKKLVEDIAFLGEVRGRSVRMMRLRCSIVWSCARRRIEQGEKGADDEGCWIDGQEDCLERCR